jgi:hypothetical protein
VTVSNGLPAAISFASVQLIASSLLRPHGMMSMR